MINKNLTNKIINFKYKFSFASFATKRFFMLKCEYIEDMHYKRSNISLKQKVPFRDEHNSLVEQFEKKGASIIGGMVNI
jgi:hypothetical protein